MSRSYSRSSYVICITPIHDIVKQASGMSFSGDTYESRVDRISYCLAQSLNTMQLCAIGGKIFISRVHSFQPHSLSQKMAGFAHIDTVVDTQYASKRDCRHIASGDRSHQHTTRPKRLVLAKA